MPSTEETALAGLYTVLGTVSGPTLADRNAEEPESVGAVGLLIQHDGERGKPVEICLSPTTWSYEHEVPLEVWIQLPTDGARRTLRDSILSSIATAIGADTTLGGTVDYTELQAPEYDVERVVGEDNLSRTLVPLVLYYDTTNPLT